MKYSSDALPMRSTSSGAEIETRPLHVEEWLDSLPYVDFKKTSQLLFEATRATNAQVLKPAVRLELVELYNRPYQYYIDSQIKAGAQHTLQSIETMQEQILVLKRIAVNLGLACKMSIDEALKTKTLWGQTRPPLLNMLHSLKYLSHALIFSFLEYAPTPKNVWREINFIYDFAESLNQENTILLTAKHHSGNQSVSIAHAYSRICLAALADPNHLPYGAIWEVYEQLNTWIGLVKLQKFKLSDNPAGHFVMKLDSDSSPLPYGKFKNNNVDTKHRLLDGATLVKEVQTSLATLEQGGSLSTSAKMSPYFAKLILGHLARVWGNQPTRATQRKESTGTLDLACGLNAAFFMLNNEIEFSEPVNTHPDTTDSDNVAHLSDPEITPRENYRMEKWNLVDQSSRGFAVIKNDRPNSHIRVGDLIVINIKNQSGKWAVGVIRWLMIRQGQIYKIGVQLLSVAPKPVAVRACSGSALDSRFRRALLICDQNDKNSISIITSKGLFIKNRDLEVSEGTVIHKLRATSLQESTTGFEHIMLGTVG